jgi:lipid-binding SYLF domain-containing protein
MERMFALFWIALFCAAPIASLAAEPAAEPSKSKQAKIEGQRKELDALAEETRDAVLESSPTAKDLYAKSYGWAVFDNLKVGFFISGGGGKGVARETESGKKTYMKMGTGGVGWSFGGQKFQVLFLFQDEKSFRNFVDKGWTADASATAAAGEDGVGVGTKFVNGIAVYMVTEKGLMASADVAGTKYWKDKDLN